MNNAIRRIQKQVVFYCVVFAARTTPHTGLLYERIHISFWCQTRRDVSRHTSLHHTTRPTRQVVVVHMSMCVHDTNSFRSVIRGCTCVPFVALTVDFFFLRTIFVPPQTAKNRMAVFNFISFFFCKNFYIKKTLDVSFVFPDLAVSNVWGVQMLNNIICTSYFVFILICI